MYKKNPRMLQHTGVRLSRLAVLLLSVQPFADEVGNNTCCDQNKKICYGAHYVHLLPAGKSRQQ